MERNEPESMGDGGYCICLECGTRIPHQNWITCLELNCPRCGEIMVREGSPFHLYALKQRWAADRKSDSPTGSSIGLDRQDRIPAAVSQGV